MKEDHTQSEVEVIATFLHPKDEILSGYTSVLQFLLSYHLDFKMLELVFPFTCFYFELELKKKQSEEEEKSSESSSKLDSTLSSKEGELNEKLSGPSEISSKMKKRALETNGKPAPADKELQEMKSRLDAIEQVIKEITEAKKSYGGAREETQVKEGKEAVTTKGKGNANQNSISKVKDGSENKEVSPSDSIDVKNAAIVPKQKSTGEVDSPRSNMTTNLGSKNKGAISEGKR
eukprot:Gb_13958 [translate_table: standard]